MIIGIDLGTTNSLVAYFTENGPELIPNSLSKTSTPSAVYVNKKKEVQVGTSAIDHLITDPASSVSKFKRFMGTDQISVLEKQKYRAEDLSAFILKSLKADAEEYLGEEITDAVISVPAYFNDLQRKATVAAAQLAGLTVKRLINEPTAAALAYGLQDKEGEDTFLVVDLGGGTFDVSILEMFSGVMEVRSSAGDAFLGGEDFTDRIVDFFLQKLEIKKEKLHPEDLARLRGQANRAKHIMGEQPLATVPYRHKNTNIDLSISRTEFEEITIDLLKRMRQPLQRAISDASLKADQIDRIVLVGGATRMNGVRNLITQLFKRFPEHSIDPDTVVALGAAVQAGLIERNMALEDMVMTDVCPFTLGYESARKIGNREEFETGIFSPLIERNTTIPVSRDHIISTLKKGQTHIIINVFQGEAPYVRDNIKIGSYDVTVPFNSKDYEEVNIRFTYDNSGVLEVICKVISTGKSSKLIIESNPGSMSSAEIEKRFKELEKIKIHPREEAENEALVARLASLYANSLGDKRKYIADLLSQFEQTLSSYDKRQIQDMRQEISERLEHVESTDVF